MMNENPINGRKWRVLIADDDADTVEMLDTKFIRGGFETVTAKDGAEALFKFSDELREERHFDLCVLDYAMPRVKGDVAATQIQKICEEENCEPPEVIIFTGSSDANLMLRLQTAEIGVALIKPQGLRQLERIIDRFGSVSANGKSNGTH